MRCDALRCDAMRRWCSAMAVLRSAVRLQQVCVRQVTFSFMVDAEVGCATQRTAPVAPPSAWPSRTFRYSLLAGHGGLLAAMFCAFRYDGLAFLVDEELIPWSPNRYLMSRQLTWAEARQPVQRKDATGDAIKMAYCDSYAPTQPRVGWRPIRSESCLIQSDYIRSERAAAICSDRVNHPSAAIPCSTAALPHMRRR